MKLTSLLLSVLLVFTCSVAYAQKDTKEAEASNRVVRKIRKTFIYAQVLPVLIKPDQAKKILPVIERGRADLRKLNLEESKALVELEKELDETLKAASEEQRLPTPEMIKKIGVTSQAFKMRRQAAYVENVNRVEQVVRDLFDEGQIKTAAMSWDPRLVTPNINIDEMTEDQRFRLWIEDILIDDITYEVLIEISKRR